MKKIVLIILVACFTPILLFNSCQKEKSCEGCKAVNKPPIAHAGRDTSIILPVNSILLDGSNSTDPDGSITAYLWRNIFGPSSYYLKSPNTVQSTVDSLKKGVYQFELKVTDNSGLSDLDTVTITVTEMAQSNRPPVANAGLDQTITLPAYSVNLDGSSSSDPDNNIVSYRWKKISGQASAIIANDTATKTAVTNLLAGTYYFELKVNDAGGLFDTDTVMITATDETCDYSNRPIVNAQLIPVGTLSLARSGMSVAAAGNKIVFAGGFQAEGESSRVDIYDITTNHWSTANLSVARDGSAAIAVGNKLFFAGGGYIWNDNYYSNIDIYDVSNNSWTTTALSKPKTGLGAAAVGNRVMFAGGYELTPDSLLYVKDVEIYDLSTNSWSMDSLSEARADVCGVTVGNKAFFAGGITSYDIYHSITKNKIDIYDNTTQTWSTASLSFQNGYLAGVTDDQNIYWSGFGCNVEIFNSNSRISSSSFLHTDNAYHSVVKDGKIIFFHDNSNLFDIYDPSSNQWSVGLLSSQVPYGAAIICVNNVIYIAGGDIGCAPTGNGGCTPIPTNQVYKLEF